MKEDSKQHHLQKLVRRRKKRLGRGHGSGKVKTSGRGTKGQKSRGTIPQGFEGGQLSIIKRLPLLRGKDRNRTRQEEVYPIRADKLNALPADTKVTLETLLKYHMIDKGVGRVKILGGKPVTVKLTVAVPASKSATKLIEKAGGVVTPSLAHG